jgi:hypothetical protein
LPAAPLEQQSRRLSRLLSCPAGLTSKPPSGTSRVREQRCPAGQGETTFIVPPISGVADDDGHWHQPKSSRTRAGRLPTALTHPVEEDGTRAAFRVAGISFAENDHDLDQRAAGS